MYAKEFKLGAFFIALLVLILVLVLLTTGFLKSSLEGSAKVQIEMLSEETAQVIHNNQTYIVEIADTPGERSRGLMFREKLDADKGMFFIFENEGVYPFWMKNTRIPLKIIWIDRDFNVVHEEIAQPCQADPCPNYDPGKKALYVLEINP